MSRLFDRLNSENSLPKTIVFNLNPKMNTEIMTLIGNFQSGEVRGKLQYGPAWWFLDNKVGMKKHLEDLTATGHIGADLITMCSMLRIPVCLHNVDEDKIYRPTAWNAFGADKEGQDYRACAAYGPMYKNIRK